MSNVYNNPNAYGLTLVGEIELSESDYSFDILAVWRNKEGYYLGTDSGCSCPTPFEDYKSVEDLTGPLTPAQAREEITSLWELGGSYDVYNFGYLLKAII